MCLGYDGDAISDSEWDLAYEMSCFPLASNESCEEKETQLKDDD